MRALMFHCKRYGAKIDSISNRPEDIRPEEIKEKEQYCENCLVVFITIEKDDDKKKNIFSLSEEVAKMCRETGHNNVVIVPFAHLSNNLAESKDGIKIFKLIEDRLKENFNVVRAHFGSHKSLLLDVYGHPGNVRYREF